jgi:hypothetical protein
MFPSPALGVTDVTGGPLDGTTGALTPAGQAGRVVKYMLLIIGSQDAGAGTDGEGQGADGGAHGLPQGRLRAGVITHDPPDSW